MIISRFVNPLSWSSADDDSGDTKMRTPFPVVTDRQYIHTFIHAMKMEVEAKK